MDNFSAKSEQNGNVAVVTISGRVDSVNATALDDELGTALRANKKLVLDLKDVTYLSSAGVRAILKTSQNAQKSEGGVALACLPPRVMEVLENVGMMEVLRSYPSVQEAVASF